MVEKIITIKKNPEADVIRIYFVWKMVGDHRMERGHSPPGF